MGRGGASLVAETVTSIHAPRHFMPSRLAALARNVLIGSLIVCGLALALLQIPDPTVLGIREEPSIIMFYGGVGLLAGFSGLLALGSGAYMAIARFFGRK